MERKLQLTRLIRGRHHSSAMVLPTLILLTLVLIILSTSLLMSGTSSLRLAAFDLQSDQAHFAAEAGLVQAVEQYLQSGGEGQQTFQGKLPGTGAAYIVTVYENPTDKPRAGPAGVEIPPGMVYLLSEGSLDSKNKRRVGALVRFGAGAFRAGILARRVVADQSHFVAYNSATDTNPENSFTSERGILTSNGPGGLLTRQFTLIDTTVEGGVFSNAGTHPDDQIELIGNSTVLETGALADEIEIDEIQVPNLPRGQGDDGDDDGEPEIGVIHTIPNAPNLQAEWNGSAWVFKHHGKTAIVNVPSDYGSQVWFTGNNNEWLNVGPGGDIQFFNTSGPIHQTQLPAPAPPSTENPAELSGGTYSNVKINNDTTTTLQEGGSFVVKNLEITSGGKLLLDSDSPVSIYVTESLRIDGEDAILNSSELPPNLKIYYAGTQDVHLAGGAQAYFTLIAPEADIYLSGPDIEAPEPGDDTGEPDDDPGDSDDDQDDDQDDDPGDADMDPGVPLNRTTFHGALVGRNVFVFNANFFYDTATEGVGTGTDSTPFMLVNKHRW